MLCSIGLGNDNCKMRRGTFKFWVCLMLEVLRYNFASWLTRTIKAVCITSSNLFSTHHKHRPHPNIIIKNIRVRVKSKGVVLRGSWLAGSCAPNQSEARFENPSKPPRGFVQPSLVTHVHGPLFEFLKKNIWSNLTTLYNLNHCIPTQSSGCGGKCRCRINE